MSTFLAKKRDILSFWAIMSALRPTHHPIQWIQRALSLGIKRPEATVNHPPLGRIEVKNNWSYASIPSRYVQSVHIQQLRSSYSANNCAIHFSRTGLNVKTTGNNRYGISVTQIVCFDSLKNLHFQTNELRKVSNIKGGSWGDPDVDGRIILR
jgi:hypothetical protein